MTILNAVPENLAAVEKQLKGGDTIKLKGVFGPRRFGGAYAVPVTYDLTDAVIDSGGTSKAALGWYGGKVEGIVFKGGLFRGANPIRIDGAKRVVFAGGRFIGDPAQQTEGNSIWINGGEDVEVRDSVFAHNRAGVVIGKASKVRVLRNGFTRLATDAGQFAECRDILIEENRVSGFMPPDGAHPDAFQFWSRATSAPCADIVIRRNSIEGLCQGVGMFNHDRPYAAGTTLADGSKLAVTTTLNDGGFDRVLIEDNDICVAFPHGICVMAGRDVTLRRNRVSTYPGSTYRASINVESSSPLTRTGNTVAAGANRPAVNDPDVVTGDASAAAAQALAELAAAKTALAERDAQLAARTADAVALADGMKALTDKLDAARLALA